MVDNRSVLQTKHHWLPTRISGERLFSMLIEFSLNQRPRDGQPNMAEVFWSTGNIEQAMSILPSIVPPEARREMRRLLQPWPAGRCTEAYRRSGGILNLFTPPWGEPEDEVWTRMLSDWEAETFADAEAREKTFQALEQQWNTMPHPFFAGLTPAQVMVGGGPQEAELAEEFLEQLKRRCEGQPFESEGQALTTTLNYLRGWQSQPREDSHTAWEIIVAERSELLARRARALGRGD